MRRKKPAKITCVEKFEPCGNCSGGWVTVLNHARIATVERCACFRAHQDKIQRQQAEG